MVMGEEEKDNDKVQRLDFCGYLLLLGQVTPL
jgi:hypothetical protein